MTKILMEGICLSNGDHSRTDQFELALFEGACRWGELIVALGECDG